MPQGWDNPWVAVQGGDPIPNLLNGPNSTSTFPLAANYTTYPLDLPATSTDQWNVSYQRQIASAWMVSANYLGNVVHHVWTTNQINPAVFGPGATVGSTNQRRAVPAESERGAVLREHSGSRSERDVRLPWHTPLNPAPARQRLFAAGQLHLLTLHHRPVESRAGRLRSGVSHPRQSRGRSRSMSKLSGPQPQHVNRV